MSRRDAIRLAAAGAATLGGAMSSNAATQPGKAASNSEPAVHSEAKAENQGPRELFAVVHADGTLKRGLHVVASRKLGPGVYEVTFSRDVRRGAYLATLGGHGYGGLPPIGLISVMGRTNDPKGVFVTTADAQGDPVDAGFHLLVICPEGFAS